MRDHVPNTVSPDPTASARAGMAAKKPRRFYKEAAPAVLEDGGHGVFLDGRPVRTPSKGPLRLPAASLAEAVAAEWQAQGETIEPATMPLTQLSNTALERVAPARSALVAELMGYVDADVLCYHADRPADLAARQARDWQPVLDWAAEALSVPLAVTRGVMPIRQTPEAVAALQAAMEALDDWALTSAQCAAGATGSLVLALALTHGRLDGTACFELSRLEETFQMEQWGEDREALAMREGVRRDVLAAETVWRLTRV